MGDAEDGAFRLVAEALNFPAVGEDDLLHDGEAEAGAFLMRREIGLENLLPAFGRDAGAVVADFEGRLAGADAPR